ncbi:hypothetical protein, partial [Symmachiella dynata]|uniref:hypothetical protein n=1 Tax=Symmachiella dynata TaxID=2527995 RepID=UPI0030EDC97C
MFADPGGVIRTVGRYDTANSVWLLQHRLTDEFGNLYALVGDVAGLADAYHTQGYFMTEYNQRPLAVRLLFVAVAVVCFGQAYRIAAAVGGSAEPASVAQTSTASPATLPRYVEKRIEEVQAGDLVLARNEETGELASKRVVRTFRLTSDHIRKLEIRAAS